MSFFIFCYKSLLVWLHIYSGIAKDIEAIFDTLKYELDRPLPKGKYKKVIGLAKDELGGEIITEFAVMRLKET